MVAVVAWFASRIRETFPERRRWRLRDPGGLCICVAESVRTQTDTYVRPSTGIGQARALAIIAPSLNRAYRDVDLQNLCFPHQLRDELENDLVILGGPKNNPIASLVLSRIQQGAGVTLTADRLAYPEGEPIELGAASDSTDYGLAARISNPHSDRGHSVIILAGAHTYGVVAAARWLTESNRPRRVSRGAGFVAVVRSELHNGHVLRPHELHFSEIKAVD